VNLTLRPAGIFCKAILVSLAPALLLAPALPAQSSVATTEIASNLLVFATTSGNVVASVGPDGALLVGTPPAASTSEISDILASRTKSSVRYVVIAPHNPAHSEGDAGWGKRGAFVAMHENALRRLGGNVMGAPTPLAGRFVQLGVERPRIAFSEVLAFDVNGDAIHIVHQKPAYSDADSIVHFHTAMLVYLGEVFPGDGYPVVDASQGGKLDGVIDILQGWTDSRMWVVPARGKPATGVTIKAFADMIVAVRGRVKRLVDAGRTDEQIVAAHPSADFDAEWVHGRVTPDDFVREAVSAFHGQ
jgi:cyclase